MVPKLESDELVTSGGSVERTRSGLLSGLALEPIEEWAPSSGLTSSGSGALSESQGPMSTKCLVETVCKLGMPIYDGVLLSFVTAQLIWGHSAVAAGALSPDTLLCCTAMNFLVMLWDRIKDHAPGADTPKPPSTASEFDLVMFAHRDALWCLAGACLAGIVGVAVPASLGFKATVVACMTLGLGYTAPVLPGGYSIRTGPGLKNILVPLIFAAAIVPPVALAGPAGAPAGAVAVAYAHAAGMAFHGVLLGDLRDYAEDKADGTLSLPVIFGVGRSMALAMCMALVEMAMKVALMPAGGSAVATAMLLAMPAIYFVAATRLLVLHYRNRAAGIEDDDFGANDDAMTLALRLPLMVAHIAVLAYLG